jgi:hypothetical protein
MTIATELRRAKRSLRAVLYDHDALDIAGLARSAYKYTSCGAAVGALLWAGEDNPGTWIYGSDLRPIPAGRQVVCISVSSIVEGVEQTTKTHIVDLMKLTPEKASVAYSDALEAVEKEADEIWKATHGCEKCAEHFGGVADNGVETCEGNDGCTPVWPECPGCKGYGVPI